MTVLVKNMLRLAGSTVQPYVGAVAGHPAYCYSVKTGETWKRVELWNEAVSLPSSAARKVAMIPPGYQGVAYGATSTHAVLQKQPTYQTTCIPAAGATPALPGASPNWMAAFNIGWNAGAVTVATAREPVYAEWRVTGSTIGARVGLVSSAIPTRTPPRIRVGLEVFRSVIYVIRDDRRVATLGAYINGYMLFAYRSGGTTYLRAGPTTFRTAPLRYDLPDSSTDTVRLGAVLYSGADTVTDAYINELAQPMLDAHGSGAAAMRPVSGIGLGGGVASYAFGAPRMAFMQGSGTAAALGSGTAVMRPMTATGREDASLAFGAGRMSPMEVYATGSTAVVMVYALGTGIMPPMTATNGYGITGGTGGGAGRVAPINGIGGNHAYGFGVPRLAAMSGWGTSGFADRADLWSFAGAVQPRAARAAVYVVLQQHVQTSQTVTTGLVVVAVMQNAASTDASLRTRSEMCTAIESVLRVLDGHDERLVDVSGIPLVNTETWVLNSETAAASAYANYGFTSFARMGDDVFGVRADGIYKLGGASDDGSPINAVVAFGSIDFGTSELKGVSNVYVGTASGGALYVKVITVQGTYTYRGRRVDGAMRAQRFDLGRGLRASYYEFELYTTGGEDFDLDSVEFVPAALARRI